MLKDFAATAYEFIFLWLVKEGPAYGYELAARFEKMTGGHIKLSYGTVYPILRRMERRQLISSKKDRASGRVYYELTADGEKALEKLTSNLKQSQEFFNDKLLGFLAIYTELFGRKALDQLLRRGLSDTLAEKKLLSNSVQTL